MVTVMAQVGSIAAAIDGHDLSADGRAGAVNGNGIRIRACGVAGAVGYRNTERNGGGRSGRSGY